MYGWVIEFIIMAGSTCAAIMTITTMIVIIFKYSKKLREKWKLSLKVALGIEDINKNLEEHFEQAVTRDKDIASLQAGVLFSIKKDLRETCNKVLKKGYVTPLEREILVEGQAAYKGLNGNSTLCDKLIVSLSKPTKE